MSTLHHYRVKQPIRFLLVVVCFVILEGCTLSYDHVTQANVKPQPCVAVLTKKVNCENLPLTFDDIQPHSEVSQQMLPIHLRADVLMSELEDIRNDR